MRATAPALALIALVCVSGCFNDPESRLAEIRAMQAGGRFDESIQPLRVLLTADPDNPEANYRLGIALVQTGRSSLALWPLMKAAQSESLGIQASLLLSSTLTAQESYEEAIRAVNRVLKSEPDNITALAARARASIGASKPAAALADANHMLELRPDDGAAYSIKTAALVDLGRYDEALAAQFTLKDLTEAGTSVDKAARACGVLARFQADQEQVEEAEVTFKECLEKYPTHPMVRNWATSFYLSVDQPDDAIAIWQSAIESNPEDLQLRVVLSNVLKQTGRLDEAQKTMEDAAKLFDSAAAWQTLSSLYRLNGEPGKSREALQKALKRARREPEVLRYTLADIFIEEGDLESAQKITDSLKEASYRHMLNGSILLKQDRPKEALAKFEAGFRLWPSNARARYVAGRAAIMLGDYERAIQEFREAVRVGESETDASLELARIYLALGQFTTARQFAARHRTNRPFQSPDAHIIAARASAATGDYEGAAELLEKLAALPSYRQVAVLEYASILSNKDGSVAAIEWIEKSELDLAAEENRAVLAYYVDELLALGRSREALALADSALAAEPDDAEAMELKARVLAQTGSLEEAKKLNDRALEADPDLARALAMKGTFAAQEGDLATSLEYFDRASKADPENPDYAYSAAKLVAAMGNTDESIARLRRIVMHSPQHAGAANDLAWQFAEMETDLDFALKLSTRASLNDPSAQTFDTLGWVQFKQGSNEAAVTSFEKALALDPDSPSIRYRLGLALSKTGAKDEARAAIETAIQGGSFPERDAAQAELARLQGS